MGILKIYDQNVRQYKMELEKKIEILTKGAKYDVSCSSSGVERKGKKGKLGSAAAPGICHSFTPDGRCVSFKNTYVKQL